MEYNLKTYRINNKMTQEECARHIDITLRSYQMIENKKSIPSVEVALKLAKLFNCMCEDLFKLQSN